jgi:hypothetical protein
VFPTLKRSTATGIANFIARSLTIAAPIVAELDKPIPISVLVGINGFALIVSFTFPGKNDPEYEDVVEKKLR